MVSANIIQNSDTTFIVDDNNCVIGYGDGKKALIQHIYLALQTEKYKYPIFSNNYGFQSEDLIGANKDLIKALIPKRIRTTLNDDRILGCYNFTFDNSRNEEKIMSVTFDVESVYGNINIKVEV